MAKRHHFLNWHVRGAFQVGSVPALLFLEICPDEAFQALQESAHLLWLYSLLHLKALL
jgi:hypothetical protein